MLERSSRQLSDRDALIGHRDHQRVYQIVREPFDLFVASRTFCTVVGSSKKPRRIEFEFGERFHNFLAHVDRKSTRLNSSHLVISYAVFCLKKKTIPTASPWSMTPRRPWGR